MRVGDDGGEEDEAVFSDLIVGYLFLGGSGAGMCLVLSVLGLMVPRNRVPHSSWRGNAGFSSYRSLFATGYGVSLALLLLGVVCLLADVGSVERTVLLFVQPNLTFLTVGAWALAICVVLALALAFAWNGIGSWNAAVVRVLQVLTCFASLVAAVYTGLLLQSMPAVPLWTSFWLPALFVLSAVSCGLACVLGMAQLTGAARLFSSTMRRLVAADAVVVVLEIVVAAFFVAAAGAGLGLDAATGTDVGSAASAKALLTGEFAWLFWDGFGVVGLAVPLVLDVFLARKNRVVPGVALAAAGCVLAGGFIMRLCIVQAGMHPALMFGVA